MTDQAKQPKKVAYVCCEGLSWPKGGRAEKGEPYSGPESSIPWLLEHGLIAEAK